MASDKTPKYQLDDSNGTGTFDAGDDLKPKIKQKLGDYLSSLTKTAPTKNAYQIAPGSVDAVSFNDADGNPSALVTGQGSGDTVFTDEVPSDAAAYFESHWPKGGCCRPTVTRSSGTTHLPGR